ncbi:MAG: AAA domain-containing protein [Acidimicrobiia bacterium]|nr:AAA domain-containing protein [Acidimicrobiia bacterium]MYC57242.1 AAA domain-containing protein [Acidimicrobiia bacterium]MYI30692.1 AAA domain-containing protein [Acidimicrobiia bacterium]
MAELEFRQRWYEAHRKRFLADEEKLNEINNNYAGFEASAPEALELLAGLRRTGDLDTFIEEIRKWAVKPGTLAFNGHSGQMMLNQLVKHADDSKRLTRILAESLSEPGSDQDAVSKIAALVTYVQEVKVGSHPAPGHVPFLCSYFWALANRQRWPLIWPSGASYIEYSTGESWPEDQAEKYGLFLQRIKELTDNPVEFEKIASWWHDRQPVFLDEVLADRVVLGLDDKGATHSKREANARALVSIAKFWGDQLVETVSTALDRKMIVSKPPLNWTATYPRADLWVDWNAKETSGLGFRVWVNDRGAAVVLRPGLVREGWWDEVAPILEAADNSGCRVLGGLESRIGDDVGFYGHRGEFVYGRWFDRQEFADVDLAVAVVETAKQLKPLFDEMLALATGLPDVAQEVPDDNPFKSLVDEWLAVTDYPNQWHKDCVAQRERFAELLAPDRISIDDWPEIRRIWTTKEAGGAGAMGTLNKALKDADESEIHRFLEIVRYLCWGDDPDVERIRRVLEDDEMGFKGLGETLVMKFLWLTHPEFYGRLYKYWDDNGKQAVLKRLNIEEPNGSRAEKQYESSRLLNELTEPFFPGDTMAQTEFLYWVLRRSEEPEHGVPEAGESDTDNGTDPLEELADELLIERGFLDDVVALLKDKGQVIFYGPPGTGKTYLARKLAAALTADSSCRALVQFHPSSSYEDFFEGYRPEADDGDMTYQLTLGPLALIAERAESAPGRPHVMIIDEINRANLPKVLGELLFLLEYRDEAIQTLYRPEEEFVLSPNLWFIGTMNTADRSIALVDAALRRRFHFIPFFPNRKPIAGLLDRWLEANDQPAWVGELVAQVNDELKDALGGDDLLIGPSHFMKSGLDSEAVRRIWEYNIEPFIEDQFFGDPAEIERFRFNNVYQRYRSYSGQDELEAIQEQLGATEPSDESEVSQASQDIGAE